MVQKDVLIVDDDHFIRTVMTDILSDGYYVLDAKDGKECIEKTLKHSPDLIILDIEMPGINGIEVCRQLKNSKDTANIPIILLTARRNQNYILDGLQAGADDYLTKPIDANEVLARVNAHLKYSDFYTSLEKEDLQMLLELSDSVSKLRNPIKILQQIVEKFSDLVGVDRCSIVGIDEQNDIVVKASNDLKDDTEIKVKLSSYPEISKAYETRRAVVVNDVNADPLMEPVRENLKIRGLNSMIVVPISKKENIIGTLFLGMATSLPEKMTERIFKLCHLVANISASALENAILFETMNSSKEFFEEMSIRDHLTRLYTQNYFYEQLEKEFSRCSRYNTALTLMLCEISDFRKIYTKYGRSFGDSLLKQVGAAIKTVVRKSDIPSRYVGEDFAVLLPNTDTQNTLHLAKRIVRKLKGVTLPDTKETINISIGISTLSTRSKDPESILQFADLALDDSRSKGPNEITVFEGTHGSLT